jgi:hypothetical protein
MPQKLVHNIRVPVVTPTECDECPKGGDSYLGVRVSEASTYKRSEKRERRFRNRSKFRARAKDLGKIETKTYVQIVAGLKTVDYFRDEFRADGNLGYILE